jgi:hypothetical protein
LTTGKESRQIAAEEPPKTKKPAATTGVTAGSIDFSGAFSGVNRMKPSRTLGSPSLKRPWMASQA